MQTGLITANASEATSTNVITAAKLEELVATKALTKAEAELIAKKAGINLQNTTSLFSGLKTTISGLGSGIMAVASAHPVIAAITVAITVCGVAALVAKKKHEAAAKAIKENYENAKTAINETKENLESTTSKTEEIKEEYAKLAQGVDLLTNANKNLSSDNYERFLDLSNDLSNLYPSLTKGYDENGNAILNLSGDVDTIVGSLDNLIDRQQQLANLEIMEQMPDLFKGYMSDVSDYEDNLKEAERIQSKVQSAYDKLMEFGINAEFELSGRALNFNSHGFDWYKDLFNAIGIEVEKVNTGDIVNGVYTSKAVTSDGAEITAQMVYDSYVSAFNKATENVKYAKDELKNETSTINEYLNTWLQSEFTYNQVEDSGLQKAIQDMLFNFDWDSLPEDVDSNDWESVSEYLRRNILFAIKDVQGNEEISNAISEVFSNAELDIGDKIKYIKQIQDYFEEDNVITVYLQAELEEAQTEQNYQDKLKTLEEPFQNFKDSVAKAKSAYDELKSYNQDDTISFTVRPVIDTSELEEAGWTDVGDGKATVFSTARSNEDETKTVVVTPITPDGKVLSPDTVNDYIDRLLNGEEIDADIKMAIFEGDDSVEQAKKFCEEIHNLHSDYFLGVAEAFDELEQAADDAGISVSELIEHTLLSRVFHST